MDFYVHDDVDDVDCVGYDVADYGVDDEDAHDDLVGLWNQFGFILKLFNMVFPLCEWFFV